MYVHDITGRKFCNYLLYPHSSLRPSSSYTYIKKIIHFNIHQVAVWETFLSLSPYSCIANIYGRKKFIVTARVMWTSRDFYSFLFSCLCIYHIFFFFVYKVRSSFISWFPHSSPFPYLLLLLHGDVLWMERNEKCDMCSSISFLFSICVTVGKAAWNYAKKRVPYSWMEKES